MVMGVGYVSLCALVILVVVKVLKWRKRMQLP